MSQKEKAHPEGCAFSCFLPEFSSVAVGEAILADYLTEGLARGGEKAFKSKVNQLRQRSSILFFHDSPPYSAVGIV